MAKKFGQVLGVFQTLDTAIGISNLYNTYYDKLKLARSLYESSLSFTPAKTLSTFLEMCGTYVTNSMPLMMFEQMYLILVQPKIDSTVTTINEQGKMTISKCISVYTTTYLGQTVLYDKYTLADFQLPLSEGDSVDQNSQIYDYDLGEMMPDWVSKQT